MDATTKTTMKTEAARKFQCFLKTGCAIKGFFQQGYDRLLAAGMDVELRAQPTEDNARHLLWNAENL